MRYEEEKRFSLKKICMYGQKKLNREGGVEVVVTELATRMVNLGYEVTCINRGGHHVGGQEFDDKKIKEYKGIRIKYAPTLDVRGIAAMVSSICASFMAAFGQYDVVHIHAEGPALMCWLPRLFGKKVIVTIHGLDHQREKWGKLAVLYILLGEKSAVKFANEIIVLSVDVQNYFTRVYGRTTKFIPNGVNRVENRPAQIITEKWGLEKDGYILYLGRIVPEKGERYLIEAFKKLKTPKKLVIAGGSSDTEDFLNELKNMAAGNKQIIFTGFIQGQALEEMYSNSYIYVLPSDLEGMPLSLLEAMSYGNCCVTSDIPECIAVVEDRGVIFQKSNTEDLKSKLQWLCDNPLIVQEYKEHAEDFILKKYKWDQIVSKTLEVYNCK